ncbi:MAG: hydantoinase/oxoprolinase family protein [Myxococcales bacterium]|jgi:N-methylhydantoinase A|nr:hydantoinase/oxoprolinase family protein [Myxococcales bacterium]
MCDPAAISFLMPRRRRTPPRFVRIGIDTGGTFTDFVVRDGTDVRIHKVLSTPDDPSRAVLEGLTELFPDAWDGEVTYGSTVATNAVLERRGARVCLVTTAGFEDVLEIGRQARPRLYTLEPRVPPPLVGRPDRLGVRERTTYAGEVVTPLTAAELRRLLYRVRSRHPQAIAVVLLHAYARTEHERRIGRALAALGVPVTLSHMLVREHREYERTSTCVVNAYVAPLMGRHLERLACGLRRRSLRVMQSSGGAVTSKTAAREPVRTVLSGPAGGVVGAAALAERLGIRKVLTIDMGGTSTDVALIAGGIPRRSEFTIDGMPLRVPVIDIHTVGAGGGSIARCDAGGSLRVGPESVGADPGPACYGRGTLASVTDANLVLGRLAADRFLGGAIMLDARRAQAAVERLARQLRLSVRRTAEGVVRVVNAAMIRALRVISVERGHDPRAFTLMAFGGAAPLHACEVAEGLGMQRVLVPALPGVLSAEGMADAPRSRDFLTTVRLVDPSPARLARLAAPWQRRGVTELRREGVPRAAIAGQVSALVRYVGQTHEIAVPLAADVRARFDAAHAHAYGYADPSRSVEVLALRIEVTGAVPGRRRLARCRGSRRVAATVRHRLVWRERVLDVPLYQREVLPPRMRLEGPALIVEYSSTTFIPPGWRGRVDAERHLLLERR